MQPQHAVEEERSYGKGVEVNIGNHSFVCVSILGRGSYSEVWRAKVTGGGAPCAEVALKEVRCSTQAELQQAIFEVQVLLALERSAVSNTIQHLHVPQCIAYKVEPCDKGWKVRTAMTVVSGESLDCFIRRPPPNGRTRLVALKWGCAWAVKMIRDMSPMLRLLSPIAWHRDVNSHNILIDHPPEAASEDDIARHTTFWLIDFGLAVDSQSWVTENGKWKTEYIGGDSRYWPPSSWIMHLLGPEGFHEREHLSEQYQRRLDIHGLGITAFELICTVALSAPPDEQEHLGAWDLVLEAWLQYREEVWQWWSAVYHVFSTGGDIAPVQAKLVEDRIIDQLLVLLGDIRQALRTCANQQSDLATSTLLHTIADMLDERSSVELSEVQTRLGEPPKPAAAVAGDDRVAQMPPSCLTVDNNTVAERRRSQPQRQESLRPRKTSQSGVQFVSPAPLNQPMRSKAQRIHSPVRNIADGGVVLAAPLLDLGQRPQTSRHRLPGGTAPAEHTIHTVSRQRLSPERIRGRDLSPQRPLSPRRPLSPVRTATVQLSKHQSVASQGAQALQDRVVPQDHEFGQNCNPAALQQCSSLADSKSTCSLAPADCAAAEPLALEHVFSCKSPGTAGSLPSVASGQVVEAASSLTGMWSPVPCSLPSRSPPQLGSPWLPRSSAPTLRTHGGASNKHSGSPWSCTDGPVPSRSPVPKCAEDGQTAGGRLPPPQVDMETLDGTLTSAPDRIASGDVSLFCEDTSFQSDPDFRRSIDVSQAALRARIRSLEASSEEHAKLRERIRSLEESLQRLGRESLERAKLGMEKLAEKYFPKAKQQEAMGLEVPPLSTSREGPATPASSSPRYTIPCRVPSNLEEDRGFEYLIGNTARGLPSASIGSVVTTNGTVGRGRVRGF